MYDEEGWRRASYTTTIRTGTRTASEAPVELEADLRPRSPWSERRPDPPVEDECKNKAMMTFMKSMFWRYHRGHPDLSERPSGASAVQFRSQLLGTCRCLCDGGDADEDGMTLRTHVRASNGTRDSLVTTSYILAECGNAAARTAFRLEVDTLRSSTRSWRWIDLSNR